MSITKKNHFVSQFYLKNWCTKNKLIVWDGDKHFPASTQSIAFEKKLYNICLLKPKQIEFLDKFMKNNNMSNLSTYRIAIKSVLQTQLLFQKTTNILENIGVPLDNEITRMQLEFESNSLEEKFSYEEQEFSIILNKLNTTKNPKITLKDYDVLMHFFMFQLVRTPKKLRNLFDKEKNYEIYNELEFTEEEFKTLNLFITQTLMELFYMSFLGKLYEIKVYYNESEANFITSDDPSFNQLLDEKKLFIQMPISPTVMIELRANDKEDNYIKEMREYYNHNKDYTNQIYVNDVLVSFDRFNKEQVVELNKKIFQNKDKFVFAKHLKDLDSL